MFPMDSCSPGSSVCGILQASLLEGVAIFSSRRSFWPMDWTHVFCISYIGRQILHHWATWELLTVSTFFQHWNIKVIFAKQTLFYQFIPGLSGGKPAHISLWFLKHNMSKESTNHRNVSLRKEPLLEACPQRASLTTRVHVTPWHKSRRSAAHGRPGFYLRFGNLVAKNATGTFKRYQSVTRITGDLTVSKNYPKHLQ